MFDRSCEAGVVLKHPTARRHSKRKQPQHPDGAASPSRAIWSGTIDFGLVTIPVKLFSAEASGALDFDLLDKRDFSRVRYKRVNEKTGREVPWEDIIKGYEYRKGEYVALGENDFLQADVEATQSIAITDFVDREEISPVFFDRPYYLEPKKNGRRAYALLREVMRRSAKVGIAKVVIRSRQHLAAVIVDGPVLVLNLLRFAHELREPSGLNLPGETAGVSSREITMAQQLVETMIRPWEPAKYHDEYQEDLHKLIEKKIAAGKTKSPATAAGSSRPQAKGRVVDIMHLLKESVEKAGKSSPESPRRRKAG